MTALISDPHELNNRFQKVADMLNRASPVENIPKKLLSDLNDVLISWGDAYDSADWGSSAKTLGKDYVWSNNERDRWNSMLSMAEDLVNQVAQTPGVKILLTQQEAKPSGTVVKGEEVGVTGKMPWGWVIGSVAAIVGVVAIFSKKKRTPLPMPAIAEFGNIRFRQNGISTKKELHETLKLFIEKDPGFQRAVREIVLNDPKFMRELQTIMRKKYH